MKKKVLISLLLLIFIFVAAGCEKTTTSEKGSSNQVAPQAPLDTQLIKKVAEDFVIKMARGNKNAEIKVLKVSSSVIPGVAKARVEWKQAGYGKRFNLYITNDGKYIFMGPIVPTHGSLASIQNEEEDFVDESMINTKDAPTIGPKNAPVRIVEFADFECPYCGKMYNIMRTVMQNYQGKIRFTFKNFPLVQIHPWAMDAAKAAQCAYDQKKNAFWEFYNYFYTHQQKLTKKSIETKSLEVAKKAGLNLNKFKKCLKSKKVKGEIEDSAKNALRLQVRSTPTLFINGRYIPGALPEAQLKSIIEQELSKK